MKKALILVCVAVFAALGVTAAASARPLEKVKVIIPRNSVFVLSYLGGRDAGIYRKHGIDLDVDVRPFGGFLAGLPAKQAMVGTYSGLTAIGKINQGLDWVVIGGGLTVMQEVFVRKDSPLKTVEDLRGKKFAAWSSGAGAFAATRVAIADGYGFDVMKDTHFVQVAAPALLKLLERGSVDAMLNISSLTVTAASQPDKFRALFSPNAYWKEKTGYPIVWAAPLVAWRSWVEQDPKRAKNFSDATEESFRALRDPKYLAAVIKKYGTLAAVHNPAEAAVYQKWLQEKRIFLTQWNEKAIDAEWKFLEAGKKYGILHKVPPADKYAMILK